MKKSEYILAFIRISLGLIFLWAFFDKLFGLGFSTPSESSWLSGASPTVGFLEFGTKGPLANLFQSLAGSAIVDWIFMISLLLISICLILGIARKITCYSGALMLFLMWLAVLLPEHHPFLDEHIIYALILIFLANTKTKISLASWWESKKIVKENSFLK